MTDLISKHGGYKNLKSFQMTVIIYDLTVEFCRKFVKAHKLKDQLEGAARGGKQNISEGSQTSGTSKHSELRLVDVARASQQELLEDYEDFLRQNHLAIWDKNDPRALEIRKLAYLENKSQKAYEPYMSKPETAANTLICIVNQAKYLLDQQLRSLEKDLSLKGDFQERYKQAKKERIVGLKNDDTELYAKFGLKRLENGMFVNIDDNEK
jgi:four helix bundle suffix protein